MLITRVGGLHSGPLGQQVFRFAIECVVSLRNQIIHVHGFAGSEHQTFGFAQLLTFARDDRLFLHAAVISTQGIGDLRQITTAGGRHDGIAARRKTHRNGCELAGLDVES